MRLLFVFLLVHCSLAALRRHKYQNVAGLRHQISLEPGCCACKFDDTKYMNAACGGKTSFMDLVQSLMMARYDISDPCRRLGTDDIPKGEWYDFVIVGAGVAGPVLARRLSENPSVKVLLIEAGPEEPTMTAIPGLAFNAVNSSLDWNYQTEPTRPNPTACLGTDGVCSWPRGKMVSGTGGIYGMMYVRGHPEIYNKWARAGNKGWSYEEIKHYFERAEDPVDPMALSDHPRSMQVGGPLKIEYFKHKPDFTGHLLKAASELGHKTERLKEYDQTGFMIAPMATNNGLRETTSRAYLRPVFGRNNLRLLTRAQVTRILIDEWNHKASGVEFVDKNGAKRIVKVNKEVILTAGAVGSPQILLNSGIGPRKDLDKLGIKVYKDLPVGKSLHNHVSVGVDFSISDTPYESMTMDAVNQFLDNRAGPLTSTGLTQVTAFFESSHALPGVPDIQVFFDGFSSTCPKTGLKHECINGVLEICPNRRPITARPTVVCVESKGELKLRSNNPLDPPLIYPNYFTDPKSKDMKVLLEGIRKVTQLVNTPAMKRFDLRLEPKNNPRCKNLFFGTDAFWTCIIRDETGPENHQSGTCKMGPESDPTAVVNSQLRVHGISNIRVADASIF
ncbi:glucose dehydrogenase [FAD, quinone]-like, partial [Prorops nasuta]